MMNTRLSLFILLFVSLSQPVFSQINHWREVDDAAMLSRSGEERWSSPDVELIYEVNEATLRSDLMSAPHERDLSAGDSYAWFSFPLFDGSMGQFRLVEYRIAEEKLMRKYPHIRAFIGIDEVRGLTIRINLGKDRIYAVINGPGGTTYIDPYFKKSSGIYSVYHTKDHRQAESVDWQCGVIHENERMEDELHELFLMKRGDPLNLQVYRMAMSATSVVVDFYGDKSSTLDGIVTIVNRINSVYEREAAIRFILIGDNDKLIFDDENTDPFTDGNTGQMLGENITQCNQLIGIANYDIGHVIGGSGYAGLASLGVVCGSGKAGGSSTHGQPIGDPFVVNLICHELGHQFSANHTMYHCHNVSGSTAYEPGSGSTIMAYTGICGGGSNIQTNSDDYYHANSVQDIIQFSRFGLGNDCPELIDLGNRYPDITLPYPPLLHIPVNTAFRLTGNAADAENDNSLTYNWDQYNLGARDWSAGTWDLWQPQGNEPIFRSLPPGDCPTRYFPALPRLISGFPYVFEQLPTYERNLKFRFLVRDNAPENGGTIWAEQNIRVHEYETSDQFEILNFQIRDTLIAGDYVELLWDVAGTDAPPFRTTHVDIYYLTDDDQCEPILIKSRAKNDGSTFVNLPDIETGRFWFMIQASNSVYLDVSEQSNTIVLPDQPAAGLEYSDEHFLVCAPDFLSFPISTFGLSGYEGPLRFEFTGDLPAGAKARFAPSGVMAGEDTRLELDVREVENGGEFALSFYVTGDGIDTLFRAIEVDITLNYFDDVELTSPANGETDVAFVPSFQWQPSSDTVEYIFQLSHDVLFNQIIYSQEDILVSELSPSVQLDAGEIYFWRVIPVNACGEFNLNRISSFQVQNLECEEYCSTEPSINISASGTPTVEMKINTGASIIVSDLNISEVRGHHTDLGNLKFILEAPDQRQVVLMENVCPFWNTAFNMGFDDDAALEKPDCIENNANSGLRFLPADIDAGGLSKINGVSGSEYTLIIQDEQAQDGGRFDGWCFEVCGSISPVHPILEHADTIYLDSRQTRTITSDNLEVSHPDYTAAEITMTVVDEPIRGFLLLDDVRIHSGESFTMQDIFDGKLAYENNSNLYQSDHFSIIATTPGNGFLGTPRVNFVITTSVFQPLPTGHDISLYPNPADQQLHLSITGDRFLIDEVVIFNSIGQQVHTTKEINNRIATLDIHMLSPGFYVVLVRADDYIERLKFIKN